jgi:hypothetical protein
MLTRNTENGNKRCKILNKVLNMNWDYVRGKKKQKENKNKQTKRKQTKKNINLIGVNANGCVC